LVIDVNYSDRYYHKGVGIFVILYEWICVYAPFLNDKRGIHQMTYHLGLELFVVKWDFCFVMVVKKIMTGYDSICYIIA
jgi:hypothetical protein